MIIKLWIPFINSVTSRNPVALAYSQHFLFVCFVCFFQQIFCKTVQLSIKNMYTLLHLESFSSFQKWDVSFRLHLWRFLPDCRILSLILHKLRSRPTETALHLTPASTGCGLLWALTASTFGRWTAVIAGLVPLNTSVRKESFPLCQDRRGLVDIVKLLLMLWSLACEWMR